MTLRSWLIASFRRALAGLGLSIHRRHSILALQEDNHRVEIELAALRSALVAADGRAIYTLTTEDIDSREKTQRIISAIQDFGRSDFANLACWLFASSLNNHRVVHQRLDEASLLWRAIGWTEGPILEIGRAAGGSTLILLGASGDRRVVSIDRAPSHAWMAQNVFEREDVAERLTFYRRSSREPIAEDAFGMMFIDGDHSIEGVCHDIATYCNRLRPFGAWPALAAFHDGADNPLTFVEPVKHACDLLLTEGAARKVESWGSMLVLEKIAPIDPARWYAKQHVEFWRGLEPGEPDFVSRIVSGTMTGKNTPALGHAGHNLLSDANIDEMPWIAERVSVDRLPLNEDNPLRLVVARPGAHTHAIRQGFIPGVACWTFAAFVRPSRHGRFRFFVGNGDGGVLAHADLELSANARVLGGGAALGARLLDAFRLPLRLFRLFAVDRRARLDRARRSRNRARRCAPGRERPLREPCQRAENRLAKCRPLGRTINWD